MKNLSESDVVIVSTGQAGTVCQLGPQIWVLLANGYIWVGSSNQIRYPQDAEDLAACPLNVEKLEKPIVVRR
jgi:hypothetical protein